MKVSENNTVVAFTRAEHETNEESESDLNSDSVESSPTPEEFNSEGNEEITI